tara:strand:+ start:7498 stop:8310 length:813 start_codon:yes stop_codon:yes gene_type:complete
MDTYHILNFHQIFAENAHCLSKRLGVDLIKDFKPTDGHIYIIFGAHEQALTLMACQSQNRTIKYIIINGEPPQSPVLRNKYYLSLMKNNIVWDYHPTSTAHLKTIGARVWGQYTFEFPGFKNSTEREIDILFVGSSSPRREAVRDMLKNKYPNKNIIFHLDWSMSDPSKLTNELLRAKTVLNIPYYDSGILETHRINKALSCGCEVVSLYSGHKPTDDFYEKYIYLTHDIVDFFNEERIDEERLSYPNLMTTLSTSLIHNKWVMSELVKN